MTAKTQNNYMKPVILTLTLLPLFLSGCSIGAGAGAGPDGASVGGHVRVGVDAPRPSALPAEPSPSRDDATQVGECYPTVPPQQVARD